MSAVDDRIRVLRVIARMNVGGPALQVTGLIKELDEEKFDHRVFTGRVEQGEADYLALRAPDAPVRYVEGLGRSIRPGDDIRAFFRLVSEMRRFRPHIVHTHTAKAGVLGRLAARVARVPITVHTFHGHLLRGYFSRRTTAAVVLVERMLARGTTHLVAVGEQVRDDLLEVRIGRVDKFSVVPPGVALPAVPPLAEARVVLGLPPARPVVAFLARLTSIKRPDRFLAAATIVAREYPDAIFAVAGEGPLLEQMKSDAAAGRADVRFLGFRSDVETVYAAADVVALTSDNEGMPVSLIEASLVGRPCVTTDVGSAGEVVVDHVTGFVVEPSAEAVARAVSELLADPSLRERMGRAAGQHAEARFSRSRLVADTEGIYLRLIEGLRL